MTSTIARLTAALPRLSVTDIVARIVEADRRHRDAHRLQGLSDEHLEDLGFYRRHGEIGRR